MRESVLADFERAVKVLSHCRYRTFGVTGLLGFTQVPTALQLERYIGSLLERRLPYFEALPSVCRVFIQDC